MDSSSLKGKLEVAETTDIGEIKDILFHKDILPHLFDGEKKDINEDKLINDLVTYYLLKQNDEVIGIAILMKITEDSALSDIGFIEEKRGKAAIFLGRLAKNKYFNNKWCKQIITKISKKNRKSRFYAASLGMKTIKDYNDYIFMGVTNGRCS